MTLSYMWNEVLWNAPRDGAKAREQTYRVELQSHPQSPGRGEGMEVGINY